MELRKSATLFVLRSTVRFAWWLAGVSRRLAELGERIENAADRKALSRRIDIEGLLEPLIRERLAH